MASCASFSINTSLTVMSCSDNLRRRRREDTRPITGDHAKLPEFEHSATGKDATIVVVAILLYYGAVQFVWLNFANNAHYWVPYRFYPLESSF